MTEIIELLRGKARPANVLRGKIKRITSTWASCTTCPKCDSGAGLTVETNARQEYDYCTNCGTVWELIPVFEGQPRPAAPAFYKVKCEVKRHNFDPSPYVGTVIVEADSDHEAEVLGEVEMRRQCGGGRLLVKVISLDKQAPQ